MIGSGKSPYLKAKMSFGREYVNDKPIVKKSIGETSEDYRNSLILKNMLLVYGTIPTNAIINHVSQHLGKPRAEILSDFDTFSKNIMLVYGETEGRKFLSKLPVSD